MPGVEVVGRIAALGEGVEGWQVGDRVMPFLMDTCGDLPVLPHRPRVALPHRRVHQLLHVGRVCRAACLLGAPAAAHPRRARRRGRRRAADRVRHGVAHAVHRGRLQIGETVLINSVGSGIGSAAVQLAHARRGDRDRQRELGREARAGGRARDGSRDQSRDAGRRRRGDAPHRRSWRRPRLRARRRHLFQNGLDSLGKDGRLVICGGHSGEVVPFDIIPFFRAQKQVIGSFIYHPHRGRELSRACARRADHASRPPDVPARRRARGDGDDGAPRALRQDRPQALKGAR